MEWQQFHLDTPPSQPGIYAIKGGERWMYVGRSVNVAKRLSSKRHPAQITRGLTALALSYWWFPCAEHQRSTENRLIAELDPEWNGGTAHGIGDPYMRWTVDKHGNAIQIVGRPQGPFCRWVGPMPGEVLAFLEHC